MGQTYSTTKISCCVAAAAIGCAALSLRLAYILWQNKTKKTRALVAAVLFFPDSGKSYQVLSGTIKSAKTSIDVCVYTISSRKLVDILINAHRNGIVVRVVTDREQESISGSQLWLLRKSGIQVRTNSSSYLMHHKFCVVDESCLINGSLNWTSQGVECNEENVIITSETVFVKKFLEQFDKLWNRYDPINLQ